MEIALTVADAEPGQAGVRRETAIVDTPLPADNRPVAVAVPFAPTDSRAGAIVAVVELSSYAGHAPPPELVARLDRDLQRAAVASTRPAGGQPTGTAAAFVTGVLPGLTQDARRRTSLVFLADAVDAPLTRDVALSADDEHLAKLADRVIAKLSEPAAAPYDRDRIAWLLESTSLSFLAEAQSARTLPKPLEAVLAIHAGEAARHEGTVEEILKGAHNLADLDKALVTENTILLTDSSPAARVRAYDWLAKRGRAPAGYDPLGPTRQRSDALERWVRGNGTAVPAAGTVGPATRNSTTTRP